MFKNGEAIQTGDLLIELEKYKIKKRYSYPAVSLFYLTLLNSRCSIDTTNL